MRCIESGSEAVAERLDRTAQGYKRFRCRDCGKQFNERTGTLLNRTQYPSDVIALVASSAPDQPPGSAGAMTSFATFSVPAPANTSLFPPTVADYNSSAARSPS
jgi:hypothetical protein